MTAALLAVGVAVAGCGGGSSTPGVATLSTSTSTAGSSDGGSTQATGLLAYASCVRSHGVPNFPDPNSTGEIPKKALLELKEGGPRIQAAENACKDLLPAGGSLSGQPSQPVTAQQQQDYLHAAACMRSHGITNFPDPTFSKGDVEFPIPSRDTHSARFTQARQACQKLIPAGLPYSGGSEG
jgi:hypothetical protein